jgi:hypothetical protein
MHERAGEFMEQLGRLGDAKDAYRRGNAFRRAVDLARREFPAEVVGLEEEWGDWLVAHRQVRERRDRDKWSTLTVGKRQEWRAARTGDCGNSLLVLFLVFDAVATALHQLSSLLRGRDYTRRAVVEG